jgi:O-antigen/teichoic acid export membrane protein
LDNIFKLKIDLSLGDTVQESERFVFDVGITFIANIINMILVFVISVFIGRYLGAGNLGLYGLTSTIFTITMLFASFGIPGAITKYIAEFKEDKEKFNQIISSGFVISLISGFFFLFLFYFLSNYLAIIFNMPELSSLLKLLSLAFPFLLIANSLLGLLNGLREMKKYGIAMIFQSILKLVIAIPLIYLGFGVMGAIVGIVASDIGYCLLLIWISRIYININFQNLVSISKMMLIFGIKKIETNAVNLINTQADTVLVGYFLSATYLGYYSVALRLSKFFWLIPQTIQRITYPATSEYWAKGDQRTLQKMYDKSMKYTACILFPIGLGVSFFGKDIILLIFGEDFMPAVIPLLFLLIGTVLAGATTQSVGASMPAIGRPGLSLKVTIVSASTNLCLNLLLIPSIGISGAAIATMVSLIVHSFLMLYLIKIKIGIEIDVLWYIKLSLTTLFSIGLYLLIDKIHHLIGSGLSICVFLVMIWLYFLSKKDKIFFLNLIKKYKMF